MARVLNIGEVEYEWTPEPYVIESEFLKVADSLEDVAVPLAMAREVAIADTETRFDTETAPNGMYWAPLSDRYMEWKGDRSDGGILVLDGTMKEEATNPEAYPINGNTLFFDSSSMPEYWAYHNFGAPERKTRAGADNPLPQREFIGLSKEAEAKIVVLVNEWVDGILRGVYTHHLRPSTVQRRTAGQRFGPKF